MKNKTLRLTRAAMIAALYVVLTYFSFLLGLSSGAVQLRLSEALCVLPAFFPEAVPALFFGCALSNLLTGAAIYDILFGSLATLLGALGAYALRKCRHKWLLPLPTVLANTVIIPFVLIFTSGVEGGLSVYPYLVLTVGLGEVLAAGVLGVALTRMTERLAIRMKR